MSPAQRPRWVRATGLVVVALWVPAMTVLGSLLMAGHVVAMPSPSDADTLRAKVAQLDPSEHTRLVHVIYERCSCTDSLVTHLIERGADLGESVLFVGAADDRADALRQARFEYTAITRDELVLEWAIPAAPVLLVIDVTGAVQYVGGYYRTPATVAPQDVVIRDALLAGQSVDPLPVFGCPVDAPLQRQVDPLGLLY